MDNIGVMETDEEYLHRKVAILEANDRTMDILKNQYMLALELKDKRIREIENELQDSKWYIKVAKTDVKRLLAVLQNGDKKRGV
jgi:hypothetical protein